MLDQITDYFFDRIEVTREWGRERLDGMVLWYAANGLLFAIKDSDDKIVGASVVRIIDSKDEYADSEYYNHDINGDTYYVEFLASDDTRAKKRMLDMAIKRFGEKPYVAYKRFKRDFRLTRLPAKRFKTIHQMG